MRQVGAHVGSLVHVTVSSPSGGKRTAPFRVVSQVSFPVLGGAVSLGTGAVMTIAGYEDTVCPRGSGPSSVHGRGIGDHQWRWDARSVSCPAHRGQAAINHYLDVVPINHRPRHHPDLSHQLRRGSQLPAHLWRDVGRRRCGDAGSSPRGERVAPPTRDRAPQGAGVRQSARLPPPWPGRPPRWRSSGSSSGSPSGWWLGQAIWKAFANNLGAVPVSVVPIWLVGVLMAGVIVVANLLAIGPALVATRSKPARLLRAPQLNAL